MLSIVIILNQCLVLHGTKGQCRHTCSFLSHFPIQPNVAALHFCIPKKGDNGISQSKLGRYLTLYAHCCTLSRVMRRQHIDSAFLQLYLCGNALFFICFTDLLYGICQIVAATIHDLLLTA